MKKYQLLEGKTKIETDIGPLWFDNSRKNGDIYSLDGKKWFDSKEYTKKMVEFARKPRKKTRCAKHDWKGAGGVCRASRGKGRPMITQHDMQCSKCGEVRQFNSLTGKMLGKR